MAQHLSIRIPWKDNGYSGLSEYIESYHFIDYFTAEMIDEMML